MDKCGKTVEECGRIGEKNTRIVEKPKCTIFHKKPVENHPEYVDKLVETGENFRFHVEKIVYKSGKTAHFMG